MSVPKGLGPRGRALWKSVVSGLPEGWELDEREVAILKLAAAQVDAVARLEAIVERDGEMVPGSAGQLVLHPALAEARQGRLAVNRLLGELALPVEDERPRTAASQRAQRAARARWDQVAERRARRGA